MGREADFDLVEKKIQSLFSMIRPNLTKNQVDNVTAFLNATEYGLALEEITGWIVEERKPFSPEALRLAEEAAALLGMGNDEYLRMLRQNCDRKSASVARMGAAKSE